MRTFEWPIEDIVTAHPDLYLEHCAVMAVALMGRESAAYGEFLVECEGFRPPDLEEEGQFCPPRHLERGDGRLGCTGLVH
jgi:hypothetical protein